MQVKRVLYAALASCCAATAHADEGAFARELEEVKLFQEKPWSAQESVQEAGLRKEPHDGGDEVDIRSAAPERPIPYRRGRSRGR